MRKFLTLALVAGLVLGATSMVYANVCAFDAAPAATLLYPFVAFDYNNPVDGANTLIAVTNVSNDAQIVHFTVWNDMSIAVLDFNVVLSGYDVQTMSVRDIFFDGDLPNTGTEGGLIVDSNASIGYTEDGPQVADAGLGGLHESTAALNDRCNPVDHVSYPDYPLIPQNTLDLFQSKLQYSQTFLRYHVDCISGVGNFIGDWFEGRTTADPTWMYITADVVWTCNKMFPDGAAPYWQDFTLNTNFDENGPQRMVDNVLIGDVFWVNQSERFSEADVAVHVEADVNLAAVATQYTSANPVSFYTRYAWQNFGQQDYREPLPTAWAFRYLGAGDPSFGTYIRAWKGSDFGTVFDLFYDLSAGEMFAWDCMAYTYYAWDEDENVTFTSEDPWSGTEFDIDRPNLLPLETQEVSIDQFRTVDANGWMLFVWPWSNTDDVDVITSQGVFNFDHDLYQTWMGVKYTAFGNFSAHMQGAVMANYNCFADQTLPYLGVNYDYVLATGYNTGPAF